MLDYYRQHPQYAVLIIVLLIITLFVCYKAVKSSLDRAARNQKIINKLKEQNRLANDFAILTRELIESAAPADLFGGVGINLQRNIAAKTDMAGEFEKLNDSQKYIYALFNMVDDAVEKVSDFFRMNTRPLTSTALSAVKIIAPGEFADAFSKEFDAFDDENEEVSCIPEEIKKGDSIMSPYIQNGTLAELCGKYIKDNASDFII